MAQPLANLPPYCLLIFGTDSVFTAYQIRKSWEYIVKELNQIGIKVIAIGSDSDPKYNAAMWMQLQLGMYEYRQ